VHLMHPTIALGNCLRALLSWSDFALCGASNVAKFAIVSTCEWLKSWKHFLGCVECMRCRLLLPLIAVSVRRTVSLSVTQLNSVARAVCAESFGLLLLVRCWAQDKFIICWACWFHLFCLPQRTWKWKVAILACEIQTWSTKAVA